MPRLPLVGLAISTALLIPGWGCTPTGPRMALPSRTSPSSPRVPVPPGTGGGPVGAPGTDTGTGSCTLQKAEQPLAFCDNFDLSRNGGTRTGDLDPVLWGVSRLGQGNDGNGQINFLATSQLAGCGSSDATPAPRDVRICNGVLLDTVNDGHQVANLNMYPKQPFDFAGRTGTIGFDVSADSEGSHGAWPELLITDKPVPGARSDISNHAQLNDVLPPAASNELGMTFDGGCTGQPNTTGVSEMYVTRGDAFSQLAITQTGCVQKGTLSSLNHVEARISQNHVEVWMTDSGSNLLKQVAVADNVNLSFTRGLVWIDDAHYNADKFPSPNGQRIHTFAWDNLAFDGPKTYRDLGFDVPDSNVNFSTPEGGTGTNLGYAAPVTLTVTGVRRDKVPTGAQVVFNYVVRGGAAPSISVNGNPDIAVVNPGSVSFLWRSVSVPVPLDQVHDGTNTITFSTSDNSTVVTNISLILVNAASVP